MSYQSIYEAWVADPRLAEADRAELKEIAADEKEKEILQEVINTVLEEELE